MVTNKIYWIAVLLTLWSCKDIETENATLVKEQITEENETEPVIEFKKIDTLGIDEFWLNQDISFATLYVYCPEIDYSTFGRSIINTNNELSPFTLDSLTTELDASDINQLQNYIVTKTTLENMSAECFDPHHAIVLKDSNKNVVGDITICLQCSRYRFSHFNEITYIPISFFRQLVTKYNLPTKSNEIRKLYLNNK